MPTFADIAKELGISKGTVSKAMNNAEDISPAMRLTIIEKAVEMGYIRSPRGKAQPRLAVFVCNMAYEQPADFGYELIMGFRKIAEPEDYHVEVIPLTHALQESIDYDTYMMQENYAGAFFLGLNYEDPWLKRFEHSTTPTVLYDNHVVLNPHISQVGVDNSDAMKLAIDYLIGLGHEKIGYLGHALDSHVYRTRYHAYCHALRVLEMPVDLDLIGNEARTMDCVYMHLPRLLEKGCTAVICSHDLQANSVLTYCTERGISVPRDLSILGFDDIPLCQVTSPPLTTIRQDRTMIGKSACYTLFNQFHGIPLSSILMHATMVVRGSCGPVPVNKISQAV